eukprot:6168559-Amphidinium_carterae.2
MDLSVCWGSPLQVKQLERVPTHNKAAIRKRILLCLAQARDASKELEASLKSGLIISIRRTSADIDSGT